MICCVRDTIPAVYCVGVIMDRLDETDERILAELAEHARATFAEIGQRVNLSAPAVKRRVDRMLDNGVIRGFTTVVDRNALGWTTEAYVQVFCHGTIAPDELRAAWVDIPEVVSAATVTGTSDAILHVLARDMRHLEEALERIRSSADIERSESIVVLSNIIERAAVRLPQPQGGAHMAECHRVETPVGNICGHRHRRRRPCRRAHR